MAYAFHGWTYDYIDTLGWDEMNRILASLARDPPMSLAVRRYLGVKPKKRAGRVKAKKLTTQFEIDREEKQLRGLAALFGGAR